MDPKQQVQLKERRWYVRQGDHIDGPHPESRIKAWLAEGKLTPDVLLSPDGRVWHRVKTKR